MIITRAAIQIVRRQCSANIDIHVRWRKDGQLRPCLDNRGGYQVVPSITTIEIIGGRCCPEAVLADGVNAVKFSDSRGLQIIVAFASYEVVGRGSEPARATEPSEVLLV